MKYLHEYRGIRSGDSVKRKYGIKYGTKYIIAGTEGIVTAIQLKRIQLKEKCIDDYSVWFEVAVDGDLTYIELIQAGHVEKIDKKFPINRGGQLVLV